jgi:hypothetical protein
LLEASEHLPQGADVHIDGAIAGTLKSAFRLQALNGLAGDRRELHVANKPLHDLQAFAIELDGPFRVCGGLFGLEVVGNGAEQFDRRIARGKLTLHGGPDHFLFEPCCLLPVRCRES